METSSNNLPLQLSSFIGREREIAEVKQLLDPSGFGNPKGLPSRLVTLTGAGGCGKTRLALQVCRDVSSKRLYADGVWFVALAALADPALVSQQVATTLDVREQAGQPLLTMLTTYLRDKHMLIVLDNCEHLVEACAQLADTLLRACPHFQILATSREALNVEGEMTYLVPSLEIPNTKSSPRADSARGIIPTSDLAQNESIRLFVERATQAQTHFAFSEKNAHAVAQVCQRLDGIPLAIELAAARVIALSVEQIAARLDVSINLLKGGSRAALPRQQTLRATMDWSYQLLSEAEQALFRRLSVFAGGWTLEAAAYVGKDGYDVLDVQSRLVEKSLVLAGEIDGEALRYRLLEPIRQYGHEKLEAVGEAERTRARHFDFYLRLAEGAEPKLAGAEQVMWLDRLELEHDNLRAALAWTLAHSEMNAGLRLGAALGRFWELRSYWSEGRALLEQALERATTAPSAFRAKAFRWVGRFAERLGDLERADVLLAESLHLSRTLEDNLGMADALRHLGLVADGQGDYMKSRSLYEQSLALCRELGNKNGIAAAITRLGNLTFNERDYATAHALLEKGLALFRELGDQHGIALSLLNLGQVALLQGEYERATALCQESMSLFQQLGDRRRVARCLQNLGRTAKAQGNFEQALALCQESLSRFSELGAKGAVADCLWSLGAVVSAQGQTESPHERFESLRQAARLFGAAEALYETTSTRLTPTDRSDYEHEMASTRAQLDAAAFAKAWAEGRALTPEQAVAEARQLTVSKKPVTLPPTYPAGLTEREVEVLRWLARGLSNQEIANQLVLSKRTVEAHLRSIFSKLDVTTRSAATRVAIEHKIV